MEGGDGDCNTLQCVTCPKPCTEPTMRMIAHIMLRSDRSRTWLAVVVLAGYLVLVVPLAARGVGSFAVYYVAASLLVHQPSALAHVYDDAWFAAQLGQIN